MKLKAMLPSYMSSDINLGEFQNLGLMLAQDYNIQIMPKIKESKTIFSILPI
ncbi:hypothetical protein MKW92_052065, partial [Papaver armeniacum]